MRKSSIAALIVALLAAPSMGYIINRASFSYSIAGTGAEVAIRLEPEENLSMFSLVLPGKLVAVESGGSACRLSYEKQSTKMLCPGGKNITITGMMPESVLNRGKIKVFSDYFPVQNVYKNLTVEIYLPPGAVLADEKLASSYGFRPVEPGGYELKTDGKRIGFSWEAGMPKLGTELVFRVVYQDRQGISGFVWLGYGLIAASVSLLFIAFRKKRSDVLKVLDPDEKKVYEIVLRGKTTQNKIVREVDMSKAKVSRILSRLESRGLIKRERRGRVNIVEAV